MPTSLGNVYSISSTPYNITSTGTLSATTSTWGYASTGYSYAGGGGGGSSGIMTISTTNDFHDNADVVIRRPNGSEIRIGECIESIMEALCMVLPDKNLMEKYPALKDAYDNHMVIIRDKLKSDPDLKDSYESYQMIKKLVTQDQSDE